MSERHDPGEIRFRSTFLSASGPAPYIMIVILMAIIYVLANVVVTKFAETMADDTKAMIADHRRLAEHHMDILGELQAMTFILSLPEEERTKYRLQLPASLRQRLMPTSDTP